MARPPVDEKCVPIHLGFWQYGFNATYTPWTEMNASRHKDAAPYFLRAYHLRRPPAKKEEALFWLAKSLELSGQRAESKARYRELIDHYHGYWLPETLYTYILFEQQDGHRAETEPFVKRLREEYPNSQWTQKLDAK